MSNGSSGGVNGKAGARRPIRLLEVIGNAITGGMETYARNLIANLPRAQEFIGFLAPRMAFSIFITEIRSTVSMRCSLFFKYPIYFSIPARTCQYFAKENRPAKARRFSLCRNPHIGTERRRKF